jgi:hypothetical protein
MREVHVLCYVGFNVVLPASLGFRDVYMSFSHANLHTPVAIRLAFEMTWDMETEEVFRVGMPRFTDGRPTNAPVGEPPQYTLRTSPSVPFETAWVQSARGDPSTPYADSALLIRIRDVSKLPHSGDLVELEVLADNGIYAFCSLPASFNTQSARPIEAFVLTSSTSARIANTLTGTFRNVSDPQVTAAIHHEQMGPGCDQLSYCSGHGLCDFCPERCVCFDGFGSAQDLEYTGQGLAPSCRDRVCPLGVAVASVPSSASRAHGLAECSNAGVCDRFTGTCKCHEPWTGTACDKLRCPNDCSGHGTCVSMAEMTRLSEAMPLMDPDAAVEYGVDQHGAAWDADVVRGEPSCLSSCHTHTLNIYTRLYSHYVCYLSFTTPYAYA